MNIQTLDDKERFMLIWVVTFLVVTTVLVIAWLVTNAVFFQMCLYAVPVVAIAVLARKAFKQ